MARAEPEVAVVSIFSPKRSLGMVQADPAALSMARLPWQAISSASGAI